MNEFLSQLQNKVTKYETLLSEKDLELLYWKSKVINQNDSLTLSEQELKDHLISNLQLELNKLKNKESKSILNTSLNSLHIPKLDSKVWHV
jgi:hypothetical protein